MAKLRRLSIVLVLAISSGCSDRPKAPPLVNDTVYQNDKVGLRFLAPEGWSIASRAELPAVLPKPVILVAYHLNKGENHSELEVLAADLPEGSDLTAFLVEHQIGAAAWVPKAPTGNATINGSDATTIVMTRHAGKGEIRREATAFRRGDRVFFFIITFAAGDAAHRDAARQSVQSAAWSK